VTESLEGADVSDAVARAHSHEWARVLAATVYVARDLDLAEECAQDAFEQALHTWSRTGIPARPGAWLTTVARNRARDRLRQDAVFRRAMPQLVVDSPVPGPEDQVRNTVDDDMLRLIFTCCHPALSQDAQVALTLRLICGLTTLEVARAFLVQESTMAARITRAKKKIAVARVPYRVPSRKELPERIDAVLEVLHLVFTTGHTAPVGDVLVRDDLTNNAIYLARMLHTLMPAHAEATGLLALMLVTDARRNTRLSAAGRLLLLSEQDRSEWDTVRIDEGVALLTESLGAGAPTRYGVQAAIAALHAQAPNWEETDWHEITALYDVLLRLWPSPVVQLNRAIALGFRDGAEAGLAALTTLLNEPALAAYGYLSAARADFLGQLRRWEEAVAAYEEALTLTDNDVERAFLSDRLAHARAHLEG
jgi:RNA polymerase sigma-70 factor (ECF subfamily)